MTSIVQQQAELYSGLWSSVEPYAEVSPGETHVAMFQAMTGATDATVLDAGCGSGKGAQALAKAGFDVTMCDLTDAGLMSNLIRDTQAVYLGNVCLWHPLTAFGRWDYVYCCDVLEHIPTEYTMLTIARLLEVAKHGVFLTIALVPDQFGVWVGEHLHKTVQPFQWWRDRLRDLGDLVECRDCLLTGVYLVRPKR